MPACLHIIGNVIRNQCNYNPNLVREIIKCILSEKKVN